MKNRFALLLPLAAALAFSGCKKDKDSNVPASTVAELRAALVTSPEKFTISDPQFSGNEFTTASGIQFYFPPNCLIDLAGNVVTTPVDFEVKSMLGAKDMILNNCPTMGPEGLFISGGQFSITATSEGKALTINSASRNPWIYVTVPTRLTGTSRDSSFLIWKGIPTPTGSNTPVTWARVDPINLDTINNSVILSNTATDNLGTDSLANSSTYNHGFYLTSFNWINLDIYYPITAPKTGIEVKLPAGLTSSNSLCYIVIRSANSVAGLYDFNTGTNRFNLGHYQIPVGLQAVAVVISKVGNQYKYGQTSFTVSENAVIEVSSENKTLEEIKTELNFL